ncbi:alpha/beta fold hydrolase [Dactylosporangium vinaceum]|uniref:Alpha/beta hydrolase family protein n=1 Tax=Dactylosporangium vinaceum TaxID=53362 RepID=A0ABV5M6N5_9ACTN|nr:alpha/beta fold hydrolase [Dactylosporangium vinaceum]UAB97877.1 alpha/beta fold hydrolase [Dactylosporangium vinaceum]
MEERWQLDPDPALRPVARTPEVRFDSQGVPLLGVLHLPAGPGPHPVVVLLHGFPGNERNFDLAQALRRAGYAALVFHYRGSWGVGGAYSWSNVLADAARAVAVAPRLDPSLDAARVAVVGHSLGGFAALHTAAADPSVRAVAALASFDFGATAEEPADVLQQARAMFAGDLLPLQGTSGDALFEEMMANGSAWRLADLAPRLAGRPVLLVAGEHDTVAPPARHHRPLVEAYRQEALTLPSDHAFSGHRIALTRAVIEFLDRSM